MRHLVGDAQCQGANVLMLDWECERPSLPKRTELLACFLDVALSLDLMWRFHSRPHASKRDYIKPERLRCQRLRAVLHRRLAGSTLTRFVTHLMRPPQKQNSPMPSRPREFHPEPLTDSGREPLDSSGSCHRMKAPAFH
jgi:hypothetical protein